MSLNKCQNCGCDDALVTLPPCPTPAGCPDPEPCSEVFDAQCIIYTGADIECGNDTVVATDTNIADALEDIISYFCSSIQAINATLVTITANISTINSTLTSINNSILTINTNIQNLQNAQGLFDTGFRVALDPTITINTVTPTLADSNITTGTVILFPAGDIEYQIVDGVTTTQYNPTTGIWTCPQTGKYDINYNVYLTCPDQTGFGWGNAADAGGTYTIGATNVSGTTIYCADTFTIVKGLYYTRIYLTGGIQGKMLTAGEQIVLRHKNITGTNYTSTSGDNIDWAIRRVG
jgi:hypothetical protein